MFKNECSRNCWLAAAVFGLLVWLFNATLVGGFVLGLIAFLLLGNTLIWLVCSGRGGAAEDAEVLAGRKAAPAPAGDSVLDRAEQAVIDASQAFAAGTVAAVAKGREALQDLRAETRDGDEDEGRQHKPADHDDDDDDESILERAEERLEKAGGAMKDAMEALALRGKEAIGALTTRSDEVAEAPVAKLAADVSPAGQSAVPTDPGDAQPGTPAAKAPAPAAKPKTAARAKAAEPKATKAQATKAKTAEAKAPGKAKAPAKAKTAEPKAAEAKAAKPKAAKAPAPKPAKAAKPKAARPKVAAKQPDDLKEIKGVGPALEALLHDNDVTSFAQIAGWTDTDIDRYAELIGRMGGRIRSDDWVAQAKVLAAGGETEFSRRVDKGEVY